MYHKLKMKNHIKNHPFQITRPKIANPNMPFFSVFQVSFYSTECLFWTQWDHCPH